VANKLAALAQRRKAAISGGWHRGVSGSRLAQWHGGVRQLISVKEMKLAKSSKKKNERNNSMRQSASRRRCGEIEGGGGKEKRRRK
jgi:hypothetical protein